MLLDFDNGRPAGWPAQVGGRVGYRAPELEQVGPVFPACDVYSLAGCLAFALTGEDPPEVPGPIQALRSLLAGRPAVGALADDCRHADPARRPSASALGRAWASRFVADGDGGFLPERLPNGVEHHTARFARKGTDMSAPDELGQNPIGTSLLFEDDRVRVWQIVLDPGEEAPAHTHFLDYTSISIEGDVVERPNGDGTVDRLPVTPGAFTRWYKSTPTHSLRNVGTTRFRNVIIELKGVPADFTQRP